MTTNTISSKEGIATEQRTLFTEHVEPAAQGEERYVRCEGRGRKLLELLGRRDKLPHVDGCPNANNEGNQ